MPFPTGARFARLGMSLNARPGKLVIPERVGRGLWEGPCTLPLLSIVIALQLASDPLALPQGQAEVLRKSRLGCSLSRLSGS